MGWCTSDAGADHGRLRRTKQLWQSRARGRAPASAQLGRAAGCCRRAAATGRAWVAAAPRAWHHLTGAAAGEGGRGGHAWREWAGLPSTCRASLHCADGGGGAGAAGMLFSPGRNPHPHVHGQRVDDAVPQRLVQRLEEDESVAWGWGGVGMPCVRGAQFGGNVMGGADATGWGAACALGGGGHGRSGDRLGPQSNRRCARTQSHKARALSPPDFCFEQRAARQTGRQPVGLHRVVGWNKGAGLCGEVPARRHVTQCKGTAHLEAPQATTTEHRPPGP